MTPNRVEFLIDELVLHGFQPGDRQVIGEALSAELSRLAAEGDPSGLAGLGSLAGLQAGNVTLEPGARPASVGEQLARAVHASLASADKGVAR